MGRFPSVPLKLIPQRLHRPIVIIYLIVVPIAIALVFALILLNWRRDSDRTVKQVKANKAQIATLRNALAEACHASTIQYGITVSLLYYMRSAPPVPQSKEITDALDGYASDLLQLTTCHRIEKP